MYVCMYHGQAASLSPDEVARYIGVTPVGRFLPATHTYIHTYIHTYMNS